MRVLIVSCVFPPEPVVSAQTSAALAEDLAQCGHDVAVITAFPSRPAGKLFSGYKRRLFTSRRTKSGFELLRCFTIPSPESALVSRLLENLSFGLTGGWAALTARHPDVIYANTWPVIASGILALVATLRKIPLVISIQDIYPESMISQQRLRADSMVARAMRALDRWIVTRSTAVVVISDSFAQIYRTSRRAVPEKLHIIPNWMDERSLADGTNAMTYRASRNIPTDAFVVVYGGNVGTAAGVRILIEAMRYLKEMQDLYLIIAGEGSHLAECRELGLTVSPERILFHTPWRKEETASVLGAADLLVLPTQGRQSAASVPSKLISYMLASRPILALAVPDAELASLVTRSGCGWVIEPDRADLLAEKIKEIKLKKPDELGRLGQAGRAFALANLTQGVCLPKLVNLLGRAAGGQIT